MPKSYNLHLKGTVGYWNFSADQVSYVLDKNKSSEVNVLINSLGGGAYEAMAISGLFRNHGNVHVHYMGANASAATIASMGAKRVSMDVDALYLVHKCSNLVLEFDLLNAEALDAKIKELQGLKRNLEALDCTVAGMYARRCKRTQAELLDLMSEDRWLTAKEALDWGFIDEITTYEDDEKPGFDESTVSAMASAGIPIPPSASRKGSALSKLIQSISSALKSDNTSKSSLSVMPKLENLAGILGSPVALADGRASLDEAQLQAIEDRFASDSAALADKDETIAGLEQKVKDLSSNPAGPSSGVVESGTGDDDSLPEGDVQANVRSLLDQLDF